MLHTDKHRNCSKNEEFVPIQAQFLHRSQHHRQNIFVQFIINFR